MPGNVNNPNTSGPPQMEYSLACSRCGRHEDVEIVTIVSSHSRYTLCVSCREELLFYCHDCNNYYFKDDDYEVNGNRICFVCRDQYVNCTECSGMFHQREVSVSPSGSYICFECRDRVCCYCEECETVMWTDDANYDHNDNGPFCERCYNSPKFHIQQSATFNNNKSRRLVGFELEYYYPIRNNVAPNLRRWGRVHGDGSIRPPRDEDYQTAEFSSFPMNGDYLLKSIKDVCKEMKSHRCMVNTSCGFHVHLDVSGETEEDKKRIRHWWLIFEKLFFSMVAESRRTNDFTSSANVIRQERWAGNRYLALNIAAFEKYGTYEIRLHHGTLNADKVTEWISMLLNFFDTFKSIPITRKRLGECRRMNDRDLLILFFQQIRLPLSFRKMVVKRIKHHKSEEKNSYFSFDKKDKKGQKIRSLFRNERNFQRNSGTMSGRINRSPRTAREYVMRYSSELVDELVRDESRHQWINEVNLAVNPNDERNNR